MSSTFLGQPLYFLPSGDGAYAFSPGRPISAQEADHIRRQWRAVMGEAKLVVLPHGATLTYIAPGKSDADTPIYDSLVEELGAPVVR